MVAPAAGRSMALASLGPAALMAMVIALLAGILGMHALSGTYGASGAVTERGIIALPTPGLQAPTATDYTGSSAAVASPEASTEPASSFEFLSCAVAGTGEGCILSPNTTSFAAFPPSPASLPVMHAPTAIGPTAGTRDTAPSPSPGDLSISRT